MDRRDFLGAGAAGRSGNVQPVFQNVQVHRAQIHRAIIIQCVKNNMELKTFVSFRYAFNDFLQAMQSPETVAIKRGKSLDEIMARLG